MSGFLARVALIVASGAVSLVPAICGLRASAGAAETKPGTAESVEPSSLLPYATASCPYNFGRAMPPATFCVYNGVALGADGEICADNVLVIWSSYALHALQRPEDTRGSAATEVYLGFVAEPELVLRAVVDPERSERAVMAGYTLGEGRPAVPLAGETRLRAAGGSGPSDAGILTITLQEPRELRSRGCAFAAYAGSFVGMVRLPLVEQELVESNLQP